MKHYRSILFLFLLSFSSKIMKCLKNKLVVTQIMHAYMKLSRTINVIHIAFYLTGVDNNGCTNRGGMCSDTSDCPTTGGEQEKLEINCCQAKACCNCTGKYFLQLIRD